LNPFVTCFANSAFSLVPCPCSFFGLQPQTSNVVSFTGRGFEGLKNSALQEIVNTYRDYLGDALFSMVLFGSHARGDAKETSDYDLFIIAEKLPAKPLQRIWFIRAPLKGQFEQRVSITAKTPREMRDHFPPLFLDLGLDGAILFDRDGFFCGTPD
jgi:predicted nucleotidyltransferase